MLQRSQRLELHLPRVAVPSTDCVWAARMIHSADYFKNCLLVANLLRVGPPDSANCVASELSRFPGNTIVKSVEYLLGRRIEGFVVFEVFIV